MHLSKTSFAKIARTFKGVSVISSYSTLESGAISVLTESVYFNRKEKISSVGQPNPDVSLRIQEDPLHPPRGPVPVDKWGELLVKTPGMMLG